MISLNKNIEKLKDFLSEFSRKPEVICVSETRTNANNIKHINLPGYNFFCHNSPTRAGGAGVYVVDSVRCKELLYLRMGVSACEDVWVEISLSPNVNMVVGTAYRHNLLSEILIIFNSFSKKFANFRFIQ